MANVFSSIFEILMTILLWFWGVVLAVWAVYWIVRGLFWCLTWVVVKVVSKDLDIDIHKDD